MSRVLRLFRRHVINRTDDLIFLGQGIVLDRFIGIMSKPHQTHVENFYVPVGVEQQVLGLDIPVNDAPLVRVLQSTSRLENAVHGIFDRKGAMYVHQFGQVLAIDKFHNQENRPGGFVRVKCGNDVRVV